MSSFVRSLLKNRFLVAAVLAAAANFASEGCTENSNVSSTISISPVQGRMLKKLPSWLTCQPNIEEMRREATISKQRADLAACLKHHIKHTELETTVGGLCSGKNKVARWEAFIANQNWSNFDRMTKADFKAVKSEIDAYLKLGKIEKTPAVADKCPAKEVAPRQLERFESVESVSVDDVVIPQPTPQPETYTLPVATPIVPQAAPQVIVEKPKDPFAGEMGEIERLLQQKDYQSAEEKCAILESKVLQKVQLPGESTHLQKVQDFKERANTLREAAEHEAEEARRLAEEARRIAVEEEQRRQREAEIEAAKKADEEFQRQQVSVKENLELRRNGEVAGLVSALIDSKVRQKKPYFAKLQTDAATRKTFVKSTTKIIREMDGIWSFSSGLDEQLTSIEKAAHDDYLRLHLSAEVEKAVNEQLKRE